MPFQGMAVLYRTNAQSRVLEEALVTSTDPKIPYRVYGGTRFYDRKEIKELIAYLHLLENPSDDMALQRIINVPRRAIGDSTVKELMQHAAVEGMPLYSALSDLPESLSARPRKAIGAFVLLISKLMVKKDLIPLTELVQEVLDESGLLAMYEAENTDEARSRVENLKEFVGAAAEFEGRDEHATLGDFLQSISLVTDLDAREDDDGFVTLMTMHSAKGLEFDAVFLAGVEEGLFPSSRSVDDEDRLEEERRLCYVAITRARKHLFITRAFQRSLYNNMSFNPPSRFLQEIPKRLIRDESFPDSRSVRSGAPQVRPPRNTSAQRPRIQPGDPLSIPGVQRGFSASAARSFAQTAKPEFAVGDRVYHRTFGAGRVVRITGEGMGARVRVAFDKLQEEKELALMVAPIIKLEEDGTWIGKQGCGPWWTG
jgi:DNA helicase-2/ATP-dependent DNA helicase PcrA